MSSRSIASLPPIASVLSRACCKQGEKEARWRGGAASWGGGRRRGEYGAAAPAEGAVHSWHPKGLFSAHSFLVCSLSLLSSRCSPIVVV